MKNTYVKFCPHHIVFLGKNQKPIECPSGFTRLDLNWPAEPYELIPVTNTLVPDVTKEECLKKCEDMKGCVSAVFDEQVNECGHGSVIINTVSVQVFCELYK